MTGKAASSARKTGSQTVRPIWHRSRILVLIGMLKLLKGALFVALGFGLLRLLHRNLYHLAMRLVEILRFDPGNAFINTLLGELSLVNDHRLRQLSVFTFAYAALDFLEGSGLVLEKAWAEYVTLVLTAAFLPIEVLKSLHHPTWWKLLLILANALIVLYLGRLLFQKNHAPAKRAKR